MADQKKATTVINVDMSLVKAKMDRDGKDRLVINELVGDREFKLLEVERKTGPLSLDDNNNSLC